MPTPLPTPAAPPTPGRRPSGPGRRRGHREHDGRAAELARRPRPPTRLLRLEKTPPTKSPQPYAAAATSESRTVTAGSRRDHADDERRGGEQPGDELDEDAQADGLAGRPWSTARRPRRRPGAARRGRRRGRSRAERPTTGTTKKPTMPTRTPDHERRASGRRRLEPAAGDERTSRPPRRPGTTVATAATTQAVAVCRLGGPDDDGAQDQDRARGGPGPRCRRGRRGSRCRRRRRGGSRASPCHTGRAMHERRTRRTRPRTRWSGAARSVSGRASVLALRGGRGRAGELARSRRARRWRPHGACRRARGRGGRRRAARRRTAAPPGGRPGLRNGRSGRQRSGRRNWGQRQWSRRPLSLRRSLAQRRQWPEDSRPSVLPDTPCNHGR